MEPDGSQGLQPESKWGHAVGLVTSAAALAVVDILGGLDLSALPSWLSATAAVAVGTAAGLLMSWAKKNR